MLVPAISLSHFPKLTAKRYRDLGSVFSSPEHMWEAEFDELKRAGWDDTLCHDFLLWRDEFDAAQAEETLLKHGIRGITMTDPEYPALLKEIHDPPSCLFVRGTIDRMEFPLAVVGTRAASPYGKQVTEEIIPPLARDGIAIVSGLALGIDAIAHATTLTVHGKTIAVLGGGVDEPSLYPRTNLSLARQIVEQGGAVISEYAPGVQPTEYSFPRRNRILAGMTLGTLVIEAGAGSGALITSQCALDNGREVFAVPHSITNPLGVGPNMLIKSGAKLVSSSIDILDALNLQHVKAIPKQEEIRPESPTEAAILPLLSRNPVHVDILIKHSTLDSPTVMSTLTLMEMKGKVRNLGGMMYVLAR